MSPELGIMLIRGLDVVQWVIIARVLLSWFVQESNPVMRFLGTLTDPILKPLRRFLTIGMMDLSPIVVIFVIYGIQGLIAKAIA